MKLPPNTTVPSPVEKARELPAHDNNSGKKSACCNAEKGELQSGKMYFPCCSECKGQWKQKLLPPTDGWQCGRCDQERNGLDVTLPKHSWPCSKRVEDGAGETVRTDTNAVQSGQSQAKPEASTNPSVSNDLGEKPVEAWKVEIVIVEGIVMSMGIVTIVACVLYINSLIR